MVGKLDKMTIEERIKDLAEELGFDGIGFTLLKDFRDWKVCLNKKNFLFFF